MTNSNLISETESICPCCLKKISAKKILKHNKVYMEKYCHEHGKFTTIIWDGSIPLNSWVRNKKRAYINYPNTTVNKGCPYDCGLCSEHRQNTCTGLIEVTQKCNLKCRFCFASSCFDKGEDPSMEKIKFLYESLMKSSGRCNVQLSGGEPTLRDDLPQIVLLGRNIGFEFIQLNTNGIRIALEEDFTKRLGEAGLDSVFLQFDGTKDSIYKELRGRNLFELKLKAIKNCKTYGIGVVLVPTLVPGINIDNIGEIIDFAIDNLPSVRGVHFQPVSYFGRIPNIPEDSDRITLPEIMDNIEKQTSGKIKINSMKPPGCENALCSFHGNYIYKNKDEILSVTNSNSCCNTVETAVKGAVKAKKFVSRNWSARKPINLKEKLNFKRSNTWDSILYRIKNYSFSISAMAFQDIWNLDLERVKDCCIHVVNPEGKLIPFCLYNITDVNGNYMYRRRNTNEVHNN
ncbi:radical SAM protein [Clostridium tyrobutyricum]|uniref:radical SAM (seleno)protein TrsS n=1 Tax=Clostridium tyrobutyricum TaxID=1519 RepID=UPI001C389391|nr:radical SAM (seleno)protein TrsS [Clostridium tyrobutyricum]MBV4418147.1 radical SAM protein [Clostridium tyrobutyricum]